MKRTTDDQKLMRDVITYYKKHGRHDLPWRHNISSYRILVSEIMLQQTQVKRVLPKFVIWMTQYPTLQKLSQSNLREVLVLWQGLGYQRRAKALLQIAKEYRSLPKTFDELLKLPGIGVYTASALCAFAYDSFCHPVLETNIRTLLIEYFHQRETSVHDGLLYDDLSRLEQYRPVQRLGARAWYYALMDFGAHLKENKISHNTRSFHYKQQSLYKGSFRELRARALFAITHGHPLPEDERLSRALSELVREGFITKQGDGYLV